jgi:hypothetical protein
MTFRTSAFQGRHCRWSRSAVLFGGIAALTLALLVWAANRRTLTGAAHF